MILWNSSTIRALHYRYNRSNLKRDYRSFQFLTWRNIIILFTVVYIIILHIQQKIAVRLNRSHFVDVKVRNGGTPYVRKSKTDLRPHVPELYHTGSCTCRLPLLGRKGRFSAYRTTLRCGMRSTRTELSFVSSFHHFRFCAAAAVVVANCFVYRSDNYSFHRQN